MGMELGKGRFCESCLKIGAAMAKEVQDVKLLSPKSREPMDIGRRLEELKGLKDGWADGLQPAGDWGNGFGVAPSSEGLDWLAGRLETRYAEELPPPYIYPTPEGGVSLEWSIGRNEASLEIDLTSHSGEWHCLNLGTGRSAEGVFDLDDEGDWDRLGAELCR